MMREKKIKSGFGFTGICKWLTEKYGTKKTGKPFTYSDIQGYISRGRLPKEYGGYYIKLVPHEYSAKRYDLVELVP